MSCLITTLVAQLLMLSHKMTRYFSVFLVLLINFEGLLGLNEICSNNADCGKSLNAICTNGICNCDDLFYYNNSQCLSYATEYNAICYETTQCEWLGDNAECNRNRCVCKENFRWYRGQCQPFVDKGKKCESDIDCYNGYDMLSLVCSSGACTCNNDYYDRGYDCRKSSGLLSDCALNRDCGQSDWVVCALGKCALNMSSVETIEDDLDTEVLELPKVIISTDDNLSCKFDDDCKNIANSLCDTTKGICGCNAQTQYIYNGNCVSGLNHCRVTDDCTDNNTMCFKNSCICKQGFFLKDRQCIAELGMTDPNVSYKQDSECPIKPGKLYKSACYCKNYWFNDELNRNCIKTMIQSTQSCLTNEWCDALGPYSICNSTTNTCQCSSNAILNEESYYCEKVKEATDICLKDSECNINERCLDEKCECAENFVRNADDICLPNIGASCEFTSCLHIGNASCAAGTCTCYDNFIGKQNRCLKIAEHLLDPCEQQEQCQDIEHSVCGTADDNLDYDYDQRQLNETQLCICEEGYTAINGSCHQIKKYGDPCMTESECTLVLNHSYKCRDSICQCTVGLTLKNGYCTSSGNIIYGAYMLLLSVIIGLAKL